MWNSRCGGDHQAPFSEGHRISQKEQTETVTQTRMVVAEELSEEYEVGVSHKADSRFVSPNVLESSARVVHDVGVLLFAVRRTSSYLCERRTS